MKRGQSEVKRSHWLSRGKPGNLPKEGEAWVVEKRLTTGKVQPSPSADTASKYEAGRRRTHVAYPRITRFCQVYTEYSNLSGPDYLGTWVYFTANMY
jgi:hypothetical protein